MFARTRRVNRQTTYTVTATNKTQPYKQLARLRDTFSDARNARDYARRLQHLGYAVVVTETTVNRLLL